MMGWQHIVALSLSLLAFSGFASSAPISPSPAKIINDLFSTGVSSLMKKFSLIKATTKTAIADRPTLKFESGYTVETVFDGSKLGIEPYSVEVLSSGDLLILDAANSNLYKISSSLSLYSRPKLIAGSPEGYSGHVDGKLREAKMNNPRGLTVDDKGNIYIADTANMAIRKISDSGVTTIAGRKWGKGGGHVDGPSEDAKFSNDFDVVYVGSSCSLLVIDRGNRAVREIQLHFDDCAYQYASGFPLGFAVLLGAGFFGYMLALLQHRVCTIVSSQNDQEMMKIDDPVSSSYRKPLKSMKQPLIPTEEMEKQEEGFFGSIGKLFASAGAAVTEILGSIFPISHKKPGETLYQQKQFSNSTSWPRQESFVIPDDDEPPPPLIEARYPNPRKTYAFMSKEDEKIHQLRSRVFYNEWDQGGEFKQQQGNHQQRHHHYHHYHSSIPHTYYERNLEKTDIMFGADHENSRRLEAIKPVDYGASVYDHHNIGTRMGYDNHY
ncbi:hypothetical protein SAY86_022381 [Trapa natans]|uniref:NHL repeat-containing protein n=1 Tax=Trapa natans TaxID=22666 RepID=A0AAN7M8N2_TRANT|nr:hypothetical protein SAY86_022381 [Trapa natans]